MWNCTHFRHPTDEQLRHVDIYFLATNIICSLSTLNRICFGLIALLHGFVFLIFISVTGWSVAHFTTHVQPVLQQIRLLQVVKSLATKSLPVGVRFTVQGKLVLQQVTYYVRCIHNATPAQFYPVGG